MIERHPDWMLDVVRPGEIILDDEELVARAIAVADANIRETTGGPFGAIVTTADGIVVAAGANAVVPWSDPTAHAEVIAIRRATAELGTWSLRGMRLATSCSPCIMCMGAIHWAGIGTVLVASRACDAEELGFVEGPESSDAAAFLRIRGVVVVEDVRRDHAVAVFRRYTGIIYNG
jgi:tRNA(Arg) A34 adenosine deaminase TadA